MKKLILASSIALAASSAFAAENNVTTSLDNAVKAYVMVPVSVSLASPIIFPDIVNTNDDNTNSNTVTVAVDGKVSYTGDSNPKAAGSVTDATASTAYANTGGMALSAAAGVLNITGEQGRTYTLSIAEGWDSATNNLSFEPLIGTGDFGASYDGLFTGTLATYDATTGAVSGGGTKTDQISFGGRLTVQDGATAGAHSLTLDVTLAYR